MALVKKMENEQFLSNFNELEDLPFFNEGDEFMRED